MFEKTYTIAWRGRFQSKISKFEHLIWCIQTSKILMTCMCMLDDMGHSYANMHTRYWSKYPKLLWHRYCSKYLGATIKIHSVTLNDCGHIGDKDCILAHDTTIG